jgi:hypothetical protein
MNQLQCYPTQARISAHSLEGFLWVLCPMIPSGIHCLCLCGQSFTCEYNLSRLSIEQIRDILLYVLISEDIIRSVNLRRCPPYSLWSIGEYEEWWRVIQNSTWCSFFIMLFCLQSSLPKHLRSRWEAQSSLWWIEETCRSASVVWPRKRGNELASTTRTPSLIKLSVWHLHLLRPSSCMRS